VAEVPFDSDYKLMATFHRMQDDGHEVVRCLVKGAPDVLLARSTVARDADGSPVPIEVGRARVMEANDGLAREGLCVLAVASRDLDPATFDAGSELLEEIVGHLPARADRAALAPGAR
jgi:P-type Ca2+ transporter type 2C